MSIICFKRAEELNHIRIFLSSSSFIDKQKATRDMFNSSL